MDLSPFEWFSLGCSFAAVSNITLGCLAHEGLVIPTVHTLANHVLNIIAVAQRVRLDHRHDDGVFLTRVATKTRVIGGGSELRWAFIDRGLTCDRGGTRAVVHGILYRFVLDMRFYDYNLFVADSSLWDKLLTVSWRRKIHENLAIMTLCSDRIWTFRFSSLRWLQGLWRAHSASSIIVF